MANTNVPRETLGEKIDNLTDGHDDPNRGPIDRTRNVLDGTDDPNRGPIDRTQNALDGYDDPNRGPVDRVQNALDAHDDPNRGPIDRTQNALDGYDDPNRGPVDRMENALDGHDDPNRGPLDRAANAITGGTGGVDAALSDDDASARTSGSVTSAVFDTREQAQQAVADLRAAGIDDSHISILGRTGDETTVIEEDHHANWVSGILGGGALGAGLAVVALAIPGVGPLAAAGAIAATAAPTAAVAGGVVGATVGALGEALSSHGVHDDDVAYYENRIHQGGVFVSVDEQAGNREDIQRILHQAGGHNAANPATV